MRTFNYQIEKAVIASLLWRPGLVAEIRNNLRVDAFSRRYDLILKAIYDLYDREEKIRSQDIESWLNSSLETEHYRLSEGSEGLDRSILETWGVDKDLNNFNKNVAIIQKDYSISLLRDLRGKINQLIAYDDNPLYVADEIRKYLDNMESEGFLEFEPILFHAELALDQAKKIKELGGFVSTGYADMDDFIGGYLPGKLTFLGGRSGVGKTSLLMDLLSKCVSKGCIAGIISREMDATDLAVKILSSKAGVRRRSIYEGLTGKDNELIKRGLLKMKDMEIYIDDKSHTIGEIRSSIAKMAKIHGCKVVGVDYLGLIKHKHNEDLNDILTDLKNEAKLQRIHIIILIQIKKIDVGQRPTNRDFYFVDIKDADYVLLAHRDDLETDMNKKALVEVMLTKNRIFAQTGTFYRKYDINLDSYEECNSQGELLTDIKNGHAVELFSSNGHGQNIITKTSKMDDNDLPF